MRAFRLPASLAAIAVAAAIGGCDSDGPTRPNGGENDEPEEDLSGEFITWEAVDDSRGYAYFSVTNNGSTSATAECTIRVSNDFGNFGFDILADEPIAAGETLEARIPIDVGEGSMLINEGSVTDC